MSKITPDLFLLAAASFWKIKRKKLFATHNFSGRNVLVTGGAQGLGKAAVEKFVEAGAQVYVVDEDRGAIAQLLKEYPRVLAVKVDLRNQKAAAAIVNQFGPINHLVNNLHIGHHLFATLMDIKGESYKQFIKANFAPLYNVCCPMVQATRENSIHPATIVNIVSVMSDLPRKDVPFEDVTSVVISGQSENMASEFKKFGVRLNTLSPINMERDLPDDTKQFLTQRKHMMMQLTEEQTVSLILSLSSSRSTFFNGQTIFIDGTALRF